jgi:hypothetical protein
VNRYVTAPCLTLLLAACAAALAPTQNPGAPDGERPGLLKAEPVKADPKDDDLRKLLKERYNEAVAEVSVRYQRVFSGADTPDVVVDGAERIVKAGLELNDKPADQAALLANYVEFMKAMEKLVGDRVASGVRRYGPADVHQMKYLRVDAEIQLLRARERAKADKK